MPNTRSRTGAADDIVEFFDRRAVDYDREYGDETPSGFALRVRRKKVLELFDQPGGDVLDVGCGPGVMTGEMLARGCRFWGVDPSANMIAIGRSRFGDNARVRFLQGDAARLDFADHVFDAVLCMGVIDSVPDGPAAIREMVRVLKPGGTLIMTFANLLSPYGWWKNHVFYPAVRMWHRRSARLDAPPKTSRRVRGGNTRALYSRASAERIVVSTGAAVVQVLPYYFNIFIPPLDELWPNVALRVTRRLEEAKGRRPDWMAAGWILKAKKISR